MLQSPITERDASWDKLAKGYYQKCLDEEQLESTGVEAMRDIAKRIGGWPALEGEGMESRILRFRDSESRDFGASRILEAQRF